MLWCAGMRKTCLMVLSHLILNDMMKVKGHIARLALCLQDDCPRIAGLAQVFFHELSRKAFKVRSTDPLRTIKLRNASCMPVLGSSSMSSRARPSRCERHLDEWWLPVQV